MALVSKLVRPGGFRRLDALVVKDQLLAGYYRGVRRCRQFPRTSGDFKVRLTGEFHLTRGADAVAVVKMR